MSERLQYVSPEYQTQLEELADRLVTRRRFGQIALDDTVEMQLAFDIEVGDGTATE